METRLEKLEYRLKLLQGMASDIEKQITQLEESLLGTQSTIRETIRGIFNERARILAREDQVREEGLLPVPVSDGVELAKTFTAAESTDTWLGKEEGCAEEKEAQQDSPAVQEEEPEGVDATFDTLCDCQFCREMRKRQGGRTHSLL